MRVDYHMHLENGFLDINYLEQYWRTARERNIDEIGISEHGHNFVQFRPVMEHLGRDEQAYPEVGKWLERAFRWDLDRYTALIEEARGRGWQIKLAVEVDYIPGKEKEIERILSAYPWDYVLGSVHFIDYWPFDFSPQLGWDDRDVNQVYREFFELLSRAAATGLFDSITHPDVVKVFGHRATEPLEEMYEKVALAIADAGCCVEINAAGLRKPVGEIYPVEAYLKKCREKDIPITLACDAHYPEDVGRGLDEAIDLARKCGYDQVATFTRRKRSLQPLG